MAAPNVDRFVSRLTRDTLALIMAGGRGSRLQQLTLYRAKPAVHFGGKYRIIDFTLSNCINSGIRRVGVLTQYKSHSLLQHLQAGWSFLRGQPGEFIELLPADQTDENSLWYAGTADAVYQNIECIRAHQPEHVLILAGDHIYKMDYGPMLAHHVANKAHVTIGCIEVPLTEADQFGVIQMDASTRVSGFIEKSKTPPAMPGKPDRALASMGIYVFDARFLLHILNQDAGVTRSSHDFGKDVIPDAISAGRVYAYPFMDMYDHSKMGYWRDVGTVDAYWRANMELTTVTPELNLYDEHWPIWTRQEQVPPAKFVFDNVGERGAAIDSLVSGGCIVAGASVHRSVLFVQSRVEMGSVIEDSLLLPNATVGSRCTIRRAIIDAGCQIPDGMNIGCDAESDARYFHRSPGGVVLVTRDMLENFTGTHTDSPRAHANSGSFPRKLAGNL
jgi:glucose-1-phosphate adenylyltransferase